MSEMLRNKHLTMTKMAEKEVNGEVVEVIKAVCKKHGILFPLTVWPCSDGKYEVVTGRSDLAAWRELEMGDAISCDIRESKTLPVADILVFTEIEHIDRKWWENLKVSIQENGLLLPIAVRPLGGKYALIDGLRWLTIWRASYPVDPVEAVVLGREG